MAPEPILPNHSILDIIDGDGQPMAIDTESGQVLIVPQARILGGIADYWVVAPGVRRLQRYAGRVAIPRMRLAHWLDAVIVRSYSKVPKGWPFIT